MMVFSWACRIVAAIILLQTLLFKFTAAPESVYIFTKLGAFIHNYIPFASISTVEVSGRLGSGIMGADRRCAVADTAVRVGWRRLGDGCYRRSDREPLNFPGY